MEVSDADRRKEWSTNQSGMTQTVGTDADIIGVPRSVLAAACHIIRNSEHAESETAKAMRKYALSTQAAELDALRGEVVRLTLDGIHTCSDACQRPARVLRRENAQLRDRVAGLEEGLEVLRREATILCQNSMACAANHYGVDFSIFGMPGWLADSQARIEKAAALLTQNEVG